MAIAITQMELDAPGLRQAAGQSKDVAAAHRVLALALEGKTRPRRRAGRGWIGGRCVTGCIATTRAAWRV
jgi:hypothetical protein